ncbi:MAG TPA: lytic transglycosylase domain-containing protein [Thermoanaerobaculia bacterium]|nr:lytic transglycosylase domain-containing protein [Thermoanaerobaculia bacterium]
MKTPIVIAVTLLVATTAVAGERKFSASAVPHAKLKKAGKVVISNNDRAITAHRFFGDIREALVTLRSTRTLASRPFGSAVYNSGAAVNAPAHLASAIQDASRAHGVDPRLVTAIARRESAFNVNAVSRVGAQGVMQLMPATAKFLGVKNSFDARENIFGGARYLRTLLDTFNGDLDLALAAYNAGPGAVAKYRGVPPYRETRAYVAAVRSTYEQSLVAR